MKDQFLFPNNPQELLDKASTVALGNWIPTRKAAILKSQCLEQEQAITNMNPIHYWFKLIVPKKINQAKYWFRDKLLFDPFNKKNRHKTIFQTITNPKNPTFHQAIFPLLQQKHFFVPFLSLCCGLS